MEGVLQKKVACLATLTNIMNLYDGLTTAVSDKSLSSFTAALCCSARSYGK